MSRSTLTILASIVGTVVLLYMYAKQDMDAEKRALAEKAEQDRLLAEAKAKLAAEQEASRRQGKDTFDGSAADWVDLVSRVTNALGGALRS